MFWLNHAWQVFDAERRSFFSSGRFEIIRSDERSPHLDTYHEETDKTANCAFSSSKIDKASHHHQNRIDKRQLFKAINYDMKSNARRVDY